MSTETHPHSVPPAAEDPDGDTQDHPVLVPVPVPVPGRWRTLALIAAAQFMLMLDITVANVALPAIGTDLHVTRTTLTWVITAYTLCFGGLMLLGGRLADALGARRTLLVGLALFTAASLATGLADGPAWLIAGRASQGVGAALLSPSALALVTMMFQGPDRTRALGIWAALGVAGLAIGVLLGGLLTSGPGWPWVFLINVPVGIVLLLVLPRVLPPVTGSGGGARIDVLGAVTVTAATATLIYGLVHAGDAGWSDTATVASLAASALLYAAFVIIERRVQAPLMRVGLLIRRPVAAGAFGMLMATALLIGMFFLASFYLQHLRGYSAAATGLLFLPVAVATAIGAHLSSHVVGRAGGRAAATAGLGSATIGTALLISLNATANPLIGLLPGLVIAAAGLGAVFVAATSTALALVEPSESGLASGLVNTFHELGGAIGVAVVSTVAAASLGEGSRDLVGFTRAFIVCTIAAGISSLIAVILMPPGRLPVTDHPHVH